MVLDVSDIEVLEVEVDCRRKEEGSESGLVGTLVTTDVSLSSTTGDCRPGSHLTSIG